MDDLDSWLTSDPADRERCEHGRMKPCQVCAAEAAEERAEGEREERGHDR